jgi:hypothetical protein
MAIFSTFGIHVKITEKNAATGMVRIESAEPDIQGKFSAVRHYAELRAYYGITEILEAFKAAPEAAGELKRD